MNEKRIQQVLDIEKRAQEVLDSAKRDAEQLPLLADQEALEIINKVRAEAQQEARQLVNNAQSENETARIISDAEKKTHELEDLAKKNFDRAVAYVLGRVIGLE